MVGMQDISGRILAATLNPALADVEAQQATVSTLEDGVPRLASDLLAAEEQEAAAVRARQQAQKDFDAALLALLKAKRRLDRATRAAEQAEQVRKRAGEDLAEGRSMLRDARAALRHYQDRAAPQEH